MAGIPHPQMNQGMSQGFANDRFGNNRGATFNNPIGMAKMTPTTARQTNGVLTTKLLMRTAESNYDSGIDTGSLIFTRRIPCISQTLFNLEMLRHYFHVAAITKWSNDKMLKGLGEDGDEILKMNKRGRGPTFEYLANFDTVNDEIAFSGIALGGTSPNTATGVVDYGSSVQFTGELKTLAQVSWGHCHMPNFWGDLKAGTYLYMIIKPMPAMESYLSPLGDTNLVPSEMRASKCLIMDVQFTTRKPENIGTKELLNCKGEQPPPDSAAWIDWEYDKDGNALAGTMRRGQVWCLGQANFDYYGKGAGIFVPSSKQAERTQWAANYNTKPMIEVLIGVELLNAY
jgi:hypothetical protein